MSVKLFIPQDLVDRWVTSDTVQLAGEILTFRSRPVVLRVVPGFYFDRLSAGSDDGHRLLGRVKAKAAVAALGAEVYMTSIILGETAYQAVPGLVAKPVDVYASKRAIIEAMENASA